MLASRSHLHRAGGRRTSTLRDPEDYSRHKLHTDRLVDRVGNRLAVEDRTSSPAVVDRTRTVHRRIAVSGPEMDSPVGHNPAGHSLETGRIADPVAGSWEQASCSEEDIDCRGPTCR